jgi:hypothetical protein
VQRLTVWSGYRPSYTSRPVDIYRDEPGTRYWLLRADDVAAATTAAATFGALR